MQQNHFTCQHIKHQGMEIQGFCLSLQCQEEKPQFCVNCALDINIHKICKNDCKTLSQIQDLLKSAQEKISNQQIQLNSSFELIKSKYTEYQKQLQKKAEVLKQIYQFIDFQQYYQIKEQLVLVKLWYQMIIEQKKIEEKKVCNSQIKNKIASELLNVDKFEKALKNVIQNENQRYSSKSQIKQDLFQGIQLLNQKQWQKAEDLISEKILKLQNMFLLFHFTEVGSAIKLRNKLKNDIYKNIDKISDKILNNNNSDIVALISKIYVLQSEGKIEEALNYCELTQIFDNFNLHSIYRRSALLTSLKKNEEAIENINQIIQINKNYCCYYYVKGRALQQQGLYDEALLCLEQALKLDPYLNEAQFITGQTLYRMKRYDKAIKNIDLSIAMDPTNVKFYQFKGTVLENLQQKEKAINCYDLCLLFQPHNSELYRLKGKALANLNRLNEAIEQIDIAIQLDSVNDQNYLIKGIALAKTQQYDLALVQAEKAICLNPHKENNHKLKGKMIFMFDEILQQQSQQQQNKKEIPIDELLDQFLTDK